MRTIGRVAMPIFTFIIINGFFKTKDLKRYISRLFRLAVFTQIAILILTGINVVFVPEYSNNIHQDLNIVFSFVLILIFINNLNNLIYKKQDEIYIKIKNILIMSLILAIYAILQINTYVKLDYGFMLVLLAIIYYILFKIKEKSYNIYLIMLALTLTLYSLISYIINPITAFIILALPLLMLYNDKIESKNLKLQKLFYSIFLIQHTILYITALSVTYFKNLIL